MGRKKKKEENILVHRAGLRGLSRDGFRRAIGLKPATFERRMANMETITLGEFRDILRQIEMDDRDLVEFVRRGI